MTLKKIVAIIPARMGSSRFPGKPLEKILGKPMIGHVYERVLKSSILSDVIVATCDQVIFDYIVSIGGTAVMTSKSHERASDRCAEALIILEKMNSVKYDIVVMIQGDEPMIHQEMISEAIEPMLQDPCIRVANLMAEIKNESEFLDRNCIKVVCKLNGDALYFSREPIPTHAKGSRVMAKQVCVIPFLRDYLLEYNAMSTTPLEIAESVDMLRVLEHGGSVRMIPTNYETHSVDTIEDLRLVEKLMS